MNIEIDRSRYRSLLLVIFVGALALRLTTTQVFVGLNAPPDASANTDQVDYELFAWQLASGRGYADEDGAPTAARPPGTSMILAPVYWLAGRHWWLGRTWFCLLSAATCLVIAWFTRQSFGQWPALFAAGWLALYPGHFYYSMHFLSEVPFAFVLSLVLAWSLRGFAGRHGWWFHVLAGLALGFSVLIRPQAVLMLAIAGVLFLMLKRLRNRRVFAALCIQGVCTAVIVAPWVGRNHEAVGKATLSTIGGYTFWGAHNRVIANDPELRGSWMPVDDLIDAEHPVAGSETEREAQTWRHGLEYVKEHPEQLPGLLAMKVWRLISPFKRSPNQIVRWCFAIAWMVTGPCFLIGLLLARRHAPKSFLLLLLPCAATLATALIFYGSVRFRDSICPVFVSAAAVTLVHGLRRFGPGRVLPASTDKPPNDGSRHKNLSVQRQPR